MIGRRSVLGLPTLGALVGNPESAAAAMPQNGIGSAAERSLSEIAGALGDLKTTIASQESFSEIAVIRQRQTDHLRVAAKFPDFIDVGTSVWWGVYDWHVKHRQPLVLGRDAGGRYTITLVQTIVIMRPELLPGFVGEPYDNR